VSAEIRVPQIGFSMTEGTLAAWLVEDGAEVSAGTPIYTIEIDKSTQDVESPAAGTLKVHAEVGQVYAVGALLGEIV
jgi:pyruvate/2-oxoglutarate dehydrogenase complex dihydrolipoamide acyltransferase (E2) component